MIDPTKNGKNNLTTAQNKIRDAADDAVKIMAGAAESAVKTIAGAAESAAKLLASNAAEATKIANIKNDGDHDLLIELRTQMKGIRDDLKDYKDIKADQHDVEDLKTFVYTKLEPRVRTVETKTSNYTITMVLYSIAVAGMIGLTIYHILHP